MIIFPFTVCCISASAATFPDIDDPETIEFNIEGVDGVFTDAICGENWLSYCGNSDSDLFTHNSRLVFYGDYIISSSESEDDAVYYYDEIIDGHTYYLVQFIDFAYIANNEDGSQEVVIFERVPFSILGVNEQSPLWSDVTTWFMDEIGTYPYFITSYDDGYDLLVAFLYFWDETEEAYTARYLFYDPDGIVSTLDESAYDLCGEALYLKPLIIPDECVHEYEQVGSELIDYDDYCYYQLCKLCFNVDYLEHDYVLKEKIEPICGTVGSEIWECCNVCCGHEVTIEIKATAKHSFNDGVVITEPTCTEGGIRKYTCSVCDYSYQATINALGHDKNFWGTCQRSGCDEKLFSLNLDFSRFSDTTDSIKSWWNDLWGNDKSDISGDDKNFFDELSDDFNKTLDKLLALVLGVAVIFVILTFVPLIINFFKAIFSKK